MIAIPITIKPSKNMYNAPYFGLLKLISSDKEKIVINPNIAIEKLAQKEVPAIGISAFLLVIANEEKNIPDKTAKISPSKLDLPSFFDVIKITTVVPAPINAKIIVFQYNLSLKNTRPPKVDQIKCILNKINAFAVVVMMKAKVKVILVITLKNMPCIKSLAWDLDTKNTVLEYDIVNRNCIIEAKKYFQNIRTYFDSVSDVNITNRASGDTHIVPNKTKIKPRSLSETMFIRSHFVFGNQFQN